MGSCRTGDRCKGHGEGFHGGEYDTRDTRRRRRRAGHPAPGRRRRRADAGDGTGRAGRHRRLHGRTADRRRPRRFLGVLLALLRLSARRDRHAPRLRQAVGHLRPQAGAGDGRGRVPGKLAAVRGRLEHGGADRVPDRAGPGRRGVAGHRADAGRRSVPAGAAPEDPVQAVHGVGGVGGGRAGARRAARRVRGLALDLPGQPADRRRRAVADRPSSARTGAGEAGERPPRARGLVARSRCSPAAGCC